MAKRKKRTAKRGTKKRTKKRATRKKTTKKRRKTSRKRSTSKKRETKKRATRKKTTRKKVTRKKAKKKRKANAQFMAPLQPSPALAAVVGNRAMPRTEVVKRLWAYIRKQKLQDKKDRRMVNADVKLKKVFKGKNRVSMFDMMKHINKNLK